MWNGTGRWAAILSICLLCILPAKGIDGDAPRMVKNMRMPLEYYEDGSVRSQLIADRATIPAEDDEAVQALKIRAEFFSEEGKLETLVLADSCRYDRKKGVVVSEGSIRLERKDLVITGKGFHWDSKGQRVKILDKTHVALTRGLAIGKVLNK